LRLEPAGLRVRAHGHEGHVTLDVSVDASEKLPLAGMEGSPATWKARGTASCRPAHQASKALK
jgi:hypothetical protein